jgi:tyrosyl-tRNA synthetase
VRFLKLFTELPLDEIDKLGELQGAALNEAKKVHFSDRMRFSFT